MKGIDYYSTIAILHAIIRKRLIKLRLFIITQRQKMIVIDLISNAIGSIVGIDGETIKQFSFFVIMLKILGYLFDAFTKKYANEALDYCIDHTKPSYKYMKQFNYFEEVSYQKFVYLDIDSKESSLDPLQLLYCLRLELAKKHMIDYEVDDYLDCELPHTKLLGGVMVRAS